MDDLWIVTSISAISWIIVIGILVYKDKKETKERLKKYEAELLEKTQKYKVSIQLDSFIDKKEKEFDLVDAYNLYKKETEEDQAKKKQQKIEQHLKQQKANIAKKQRRISRQQKKQREKYLKKIRQKIMIRDNYQCVKCGSKLNLNMHHKTYKNEPRSKMEDLVILCEECHYDLHMKLGFPQNQHDRENMWFWY